MIAIVDVCSGNLRSVERALERVGGNARVTRDPEVVRAADKVVVPGQGAFGSFMRGLTERGLTAPLREAIASGRPYLGICLGLQVLFDDSEEQPGPAGEPTAGLGIVRGRVRRLRPTSPDLKIPHIGWNQCSRRHPEPLLDGIEPDAYFYFVHSFCVVPSDPSQIVLDAEHGERFAAAIRVDNVFACQFHPEKSQAVGLRLLENFVRA